MRKAIFLLAIYCLGNHYSYAQDLTVINVPDPSSPGDSIACGAEGSEKSDSHVKNAHLAWVGNPFKNRFDVPDVSAISVYNINNLIASDADKNKFTEGVAVQVTAYVYSVVPGGIESCNCKTKNAAFKDTHIELTPNSRDTGKQYIMIVEITPRMRELMAETGVDWSTKAIKKKYMHHTVTVQGWLFYDEEHEPQAFSTTPGNAGDWRASCWEIHPVTSIGFASGDQ